MRRFIELQEDLQVNYCKLAVVSTDPPDSECGLPHPDSRPPSPFSVTTSAEAIRQLDMVEVTPPDFKYGLVALPYTFSLAPDLTIHAIYDGWWFVGRPTMEELRQDLRALMQACRPDYHYKGPSLASLEGV